MLKVSEQAGVNIIACIGSLKTELIEEADWLERQNEDSLTRIYMREVMSVMDEGAGLPLEELI